jgi:predicted acetyltransferase
VASRDATGEPVILRGGSRVAEQDLAHVELTTDVDNIASQRVIEAIGGVLIERVVKGVAHGASEALRYRIDAPKSTEAHRLRSTAC